jgi:hypothetical protein
MAKRYSKVFATLLLVLMATVSLAGQDSMAMTGPAVPPRWMSSTWCEAAGLPAGELPVLPKRAQFRGPANFTYNAPVFSAGLNRRFDTGPDYSLDSGLSSQPDPLVS